MMEWNTVSDGMPVGRQFVWAMGSHGESFPIVVWTDGTHFYPPFVDTPEKGAEPYEGDTFARWLPLAALVARPTNAHEALVGELERFVAASKALRKAEDAWLRVQSEEYDESNFEAAGNDLEDAQATMVSCEVRAAEVLAAVKGERE